MHARDDDRHLIDADLPRRSGVFTLPGVASPHANRRHPDADRAPPPADRAFTPRNVALPPNIAETSPDHDRVG
jgi:hypothetical protein